VLVNFPQIEFVVADIPVAPIELGLLPIELLELVAVEVVVAERIVGPATLGELGTPVFVEQGERQGERQGEARGKIEAACCRSLLGPSARRCLYSALLDNIPANVLVPSYDPPLLAKYCLKVSEWEPERKKVLARLELTVL
jgi:hypothetical protein